jgi:hypothetical protein
MAVFPNTVTFTLLVSSLLLGLGAGIFFISYLALQIPGVLPIERWSARRMTSATMIAWGSLSVLTALAAPTHSQEPRMSGAPGLFSKPDEKNYSLKRNPTEAPKY